MTFRNATAIKAISDAVTPGIDTVLDGAVGTAIDAAISVAAAKTGIERTEKATVDLEAVINGRQSPIEIVQAGGNLTLDAVLTKIRSDEFRVVARPKKCWREGGKDRVTLTIAWNVV